MCSPQVFLKSGRCFKLVVKIDFFKGPSVLLYSPLHIYLFCFFVPCFLILVISPQFFVFIFPCSPPFTSPLTSLSVSVFVLVPSIHILISCPSALCSVFRALKMNAINQFMLQVTWCGWLGFSDSTALYRCKIINVC